MTLSVIVAPDSFKGSLSASAAADAIATGWREVRPHDGLRLLPQADGGEGTLAAVARTADVILTGEGRFDATSLTGKVVGNAIELARDCRVGVIAGSVGVAPAGVSTFSLAGLAGSVGAALGEPERWLREAGRVSARLLGPSIPTARPTDAGASPGTGGVGPTSANGS